MVAAPAFHADGSHLPGAPYLEGKGTDNPQRPLSRNLPRAQEPVLIHCLFYKVRGEWQSCRCWESSEGGTEDADRCCPGNTRQCPVEQSVHPMQDTQPHGPSLGQWVRSRHVLQGGFLTLAQQVPAWSCQQCSYSLGQEEKHKHLLSQMSQFGKNSKPINIGFTHRSLHLQYVNVSKIIFWLENREISSHNRFVTKLSWYN